MWLIIAVILLAINVILIGFKIRKLDGEILKLKSDMIRVKANLKVIFEGKGIFTEDIEEALKTRNAIFEDLVKEELKKIGATTLYPAFAPIINFLKIIKKEKK